MYCADDTTFGACNKDLNFLINRFMKIKKNKIIVFYSIRYLSTEMFLGVQIGEENI